MSFQVPYESSPPETPEKDRSRSLWSNVSTTPAGPPPSTAGSFIPHSTSNINGGSRINSFSTNDTSFSTNQHSFSRNDFNNSVFTKSGNINTNDSIFGSSFGSTDYAMPKQTKAPFTKPTGKSSLRFGVPNGGGFGDSMDFGQSNGFASSQMSDFQEEQEDQMEPEEEQIEEEESEQQMDLNTQDRSKDFNFLDSAFGNPFGSQPSMGTQRKPIYSNPSDAKRPKLDEHWTHQSPIRKTNLAPKKPSAMPSILHNLAARSRIALVNEPSEIILETEDALGKLSDELKAAEFKHVDFDAVLAKVSKELAESWQTCTDASEIDRPYSVHSGIGPGEQAPNLVKATFLASFLLQIHHPSREPASAANINPMRTGAAGMVKALTRPPVPKPLPQILLGWLSENHASQTKDLQALKYVEPNPTASTNFWDIIIASVLRGRLTDAADVLQSADFNYARSALEDGLPQPGYRGAQLQNIQRCVNKALQILESCPGTQSKDWEVTGLEWSQYRRRVLSAVTDLEEFAEGEERDESIVPVPENRFQAVNFGLSTFNSNTTNKNPVSFAQSARMAESRVPWSIYQSLRSIYRIILGDPSAIKAKSQDWVEATITLTAWWDGEDDTGSTMDFGASSSSDNFQDFLRSRGPKNHVRAVDRNMRGAYLDRLELALSHTTSDGSDNADFRPNTLSSMEVGLASVFEGNVQGVLELVQTWSLCVAAAVAEVASLGGWFESGSSQKTLPGLSENDLMVLSYGQDNKSPARHLHKDDILHSYALGLYDRPVIENEHSSREGWELAIEVLSRFDDANQMKKAVSEIVDKLPLETPDQLDKLVVLCSELELEDQGRRVSERFGDMLTEKSENFGLALVCYARAQSRRKVKSVVDLLISYSLVQSRAYPATADLDEQLRSLMKEPKACLSSIAQIDEEAARILQFYLSGYVTLRRFYEIRDEEFELQEGQKPRYKPLARRRAAAQALAAVIGSAADNIYGGLYDPDRDSAVQVDGLLALLGEACAFVNQPTAVLSVSQQFTILSAIEDLETVTPRVYSQCEECFRSTLLEYQSSTRGGSDGPPSPRALLKKSVSNFSASSFAFIGNDMLESARARSGSGSGPASVGSSGVLVPAPSDKASADRGWDWRVGLPETTKGEDILQMLRLGLARGLSHGSMGSI
ncbi:uncharacterized protein N7479_010127 [Penicillium vulpinum]|uniref:Nuclear pore complex protein Nup85 n=1 Tax=Penicillium vulpinum TaxID=29845 RepID=A0A1V6RVP4_9EURO|nr:uncharacterized protein N7479_010127 [Penicillium vulpinum]KAJ5951714.1 hypothetical protein N7479_010127 [Penicillium vulpinum]OQE05590.1 hypothetical protein PENVUL_c023G01288 [Penicillium vulpinum]